MIKDLFFIVKMLGLTAIVVLIMQAHLGGKTLEDHFHDWLQTSIFVDYVQEATDGGIALTKAGYQKADQGVHSVMNKLKRKNQKRDLPNFFKRGDDDADQTEHGTEVKARTARPE